ncbi:putative leucine-rich repeat-containing protein DDB_G0290503 [Trifolium pratense]|nr:putative leucine-rich repeat-containing protein DDB_G0290503 [Trifolium pratense]
MDFEASDKLKFLCEKSKPDNVPFTPSLSRISSFATCNCKHDAPVKLRDTTIMPVKRVFDNNNSLDISVKKSKVALAPDDDISLSPGELAKSYKKCERKRRFEEKRLKSINREIEECLKELANKKTQISCVRRIREIAERKEEELKALSQKIAECTMELETTKKELQSERKKLLQVISTRQKRNDCAQMKNFESMEKKFEGQVKELESKLKQCEGQVEELEQNEKHFKEWVKALESRDKQLEGRMMEFELMEEKLESRKKELESKEKLVEGRMVEFKLMEEELESRKKKLESKEKLVERREVKLKSKENQLESREEKIETKEKRIEDQEKELEFKKQDFERQSEELQSKENQFIGRVKEFESKKDKFKVNLGALWAELVFKQKQIYRRTSVIESKEKQLEGRVKEYQSKESEFEDQKKELEFKNKNLERHIKELESKLSKFDGQLKEPESRGKQYEALTKHIDEEKESGATLRLIVTEVGSSMDDQLSPSIGGVESLFNDIFFCLQISSDPSELVLDILQNPNTPLYKNGDKALIINDSHISLLELLMLISPTIKPCVRQEALKLALDLKANMKENTENSLAVVSFLLLLSVYGLLSYFNDDEVLELFTFVAQHKVALKMFRTLGFENKVYDFVETLIRRKQFVGAVRFSCAYNLAGKNQLVDMLREHIQNAKLICESSCEKTNSIEIKDKARDEEIAGLRTVLQCISDNNIVESEDLLKKEIRHRILELKAQKGN